MSVIASRAITADRVPLLGIADADIAQRMIHALKEIPGTSGLAVASNLEHFRRLAGRISVEVALLDAEFVGDAPLEHFLRHVAVSAPVILLAPPERQAEVAGLVAEGDVEFVARVGNYFPLAASLVDRRLRWAAASRSALGPPWSGSHGDIATIFRHEINNPLTGILGNAELVLTHKDRLSAIDAQRLQTVVDLAVRLRETIRRIGNAWDSHLHEVKSA
ncbi:MAG TPA: histidine kinase dimerization/phospho-acceptor domain-containing protein [Candidatus Baltobacteraceae bacterium]|nr:histidine kinase dimerization/phospho-acceptor domain-containing protein [Candidatus Baltobacteraceae bacterium]